MISVSGCIIASCRTANHRKHISQLKRKMSRPVRSMLKKALQYLEYSATARANGSFVELIISSTQPADFSEVTKSYFPTIHECALKKKIENADDRQENEKGASQL
jgi:hypothetical protein